MDVRVFVHTDSVYSARKVMGPTLLEDSGRPLYQVGPDASFANKMGCWGLMMPNMIFRQESLPTVVFAITLFVSISLRAQDLPTLSEISETHYKRVDAIQSLRLTWEGTRTRMNGDLFDGYPEGPASLKHNGELIIQGSSEWLREDKDMPMSGEVQRDLVMLDVYRDGVKKLYVDHLKQGWVHAESIIKEKAIPTLLTISYLPKPIYLSQDGMTVLRRQESADGPLIVIGNLDKRGNVIRPQIEYYLNERLGYVLSKQVHMTSDGTIMSETVIRFREDSELGPVPREFEHTLSSPRILDRNSTKFPIVPKNVYRLKITQVAFNEPVDESIFDFEFPSGTNVYDGITDTRYTTGALARGPRHDGWMNGLTMSCATLTRDWKPAAIAAHHCRHRRLILR